MSDTELKTGTIDAGIEFIERSRNDSLTGLKQKELGLQFTLFGLAEVHAKRIRNLSPLIVTLETEVFSEDTIRNLDPSKLVALYQLGTQALNESSNYLRSTVKSMDWGSVEAQLMTIAQETKSDSTDFNIDDIASAILAKINANNSPKSAPAIESKSDEYVDLNDGSQPSE